ncbi:hypothetical protein BY458DRAFT_506805 [Sporodiniella umbellata]|nr:hypothetical protein BY458DRAFT_506805 [Sporodiniella umbellata]
MSTIEQMKIMIQTLHEEIKHSQEANNELRMNLEAQSKQQISLNNDNCYLRQKIIDMKTDSFSHSQIRSRLETQVYNQEQDMSTLKKEVHQLSKSKREAEKKLTAELQVYEEDKLEWQQREAELYDQIRALNIAEPRAPKAAARRRSSTILSPFVLGDIEENKDQTESKTDASNNNILAASYEREAIVAKQTIKVQERLITDLRIELEKHKVVLQECRNEVQDQSLRIEHLEYETANVKQLNRSLMEDNESYQMLLHEKTMNGEFMANPIMQVHEQGALLNECNNSNSGSTGLNLAAELNMASDWNQKDQEITIQKLNEEIKTLQDTNRALQLYMNGILIKIVSNKELEEVLSIDHPKIEETNIKPPEPSLATPPVQNDVKGRPRRRTISYWGSKASKATLADGCSAEEMEKRRHSSILPSAHCQPEKSVSTTGGWAKALRRMSVIGWVSPKEPEMVSNDSAVFSSEEESSIDNSRCSDSSSGSIRRSHELGTLTEE